MKKPTTENTITILTLLGAVLDGNFAGSMEVKLDPNEQSKLFAKGLTYYAGQHNWSGVVDFGIHIDALVLIQLEVGKMMKNYYSQGTLTEEQTKRISEWISLTLDYLDTSWKLDHNSRG